MYHVWWFVFLNASFQPANMAHKLWYKVKADIKSLKKHWFFLKLHNAAKDAVQRVWRQEVVPPQSLPQAFLFPIFVRYTISN